MATTTAAPPPPLEERPDDPRFSLLLAALLLVPPGEAAPSTAASAATPAAADVAPARRHSAFGQSRFELQLATRTGALAGQSAFGQADHPLEAQTLARGGGGRSSERGGGRAQRANTGFDRAPRSFDRGNRTPSGGWSRDAANRPERARPSLDRQALPERTANLHRDDWNRRRDQLREVDRNDWDRASDRIENGWNDRRDNLGNARDRWNDNQGNRLNRAYDRSTTPLGPAGLDLAGGWWGVRSVAWGLGSLASAVVINNAVNDAIAASQTTIVIPDSSDQLDYTSIEPSGDQLVGFMVYGGNSAEPRKLSAAEAQLLNAVGQVAFGS